MSASPAAAVVGGAASPAVFEMRADLAGHLTARGALTFATARRAWELGLKTLHATSAREVEVDCGGISAADSAGLAVLLDWLAAARRQGRSLRYVNLPSSLLSIAAVSDLDDLLRSGVKA